MRTQTQDRGQEEGRTNKLTVESCTCQPVDGTAECPKSITFSRAQIALLAWKRRHLTVCTLSG